MEKRIGTFDLGAFGDEIEENGPHRRLGGIIRRLISLHSIFTDLDTAADTFAVLREVTREPAEEGDQRRLMVEASLLHSAIVLYARATKSTSRERAGFDIRSRLSADELVVHTEICDLRDQAVAHFGSGGSYRGQWKAEKAIFRMEGNGFRIGVVARRLTFDGELIERMEAQIGRARAILTAAYEEHLMLIEKEFAGLLDSDMKFVRRLRDFPLDLVGWLGSDKAAASAVSTGRHKQVILR